MIAKKEIDYSRIILTLVFSLLGGVGAYYGQPFVHGNNDATSVIVNVFSILAGFLVALLTLISDPSAFFGRTSRADKVYRDNLKSKLTRYKYLFVFYLVVIALIFVTTLFTKNSPSADLVIWIERVYLFLAIVAFLWSLFLPSKLMKFQLAKFDERIETKNGSSKSNNSGS